MDTDDPFDDMYADELEVLRDLEDNVSDISKPEIRKESSRDVHPPDPSQKKSSKVEAQPVLNGSSRKRGIEEMFGPLSSDSEDELVIDLQPAVHKSPVCKKMRHDKDGKLPEAGDEQDFEITPPPSPEKELETLARIKMQKELTEIRRVQKDTWSQSTSYKETTDKTPSPAKRESCVLNREPEGLSITVTGSNGKRVFLRKQEEVLEKTVSKNGTMTFDPSAGKVTLLRMSIHQLRQQIEEERHRKLILESRELTESLTRKAAVAEEADGMSPGEQNESNLWVDRYAPRLFTDLLSDDGINRNILFWLKMWDKVVFGKEKKAKSSKSQEIKKQANKNFNPNFKKFPTSDLSEELDEHKRPIHPVALLCGPPGLGKTTLAHVIAHHAGYHPVEINASDDRSLDVFRNRLESATQMKSVLTKEQKPNCLIVDEIDGAPVPTINYLVTLARRGEAKGSGQKKKKLQLLQRPVICICNDLYVPALRPLRQIAYVSHFPPTLSARLASRMQQISRENNLKTDMTSLIALASKAENDIRSCLNTLQFLHRQGRSVNLSMIHSVSVGQKDQNKGLFATWQEIFQLPRPKRKQYTNPHDLETGKATPTLEEKQANINPASQTSRFHRILSLAMTCGEYSKLTQGIYENYLDVKFKDPHLDSISLASEWLIFTDLLNTRILKSQNYIFNRYLPFTPVVFHMLFASVSRPQIKYPSADFESRQKQQKIINHINSMLSQANPRSKATLDLRLAVKDVIPLLQIIISPQFRPVSTQLYSMHEKRQLSELVNIMIAYNITYHQERNKEGQYNYVLDPNLDDVTRFSDSPITRQLTYGTKQLIAREIETEKLQRKERSFSADSKPLATDNKSSRRTGDNGSVPRHKQKLAPKFLDTSENKPVKNFFSRFKKIPQKPKPDSSGTDCRAKEKEPEEEKLVTGKLWFQFNQGFTNAVRKTVKIQDLL
ncbi:chromosome transmission fidelity protein 18 homolog isoform X3 [Apostichopus japonicus]|uniref:chromosome transmission fidelity protein 18 homolog isoform X3 n=1 Tax=Stichopus japonicus TaxID=307972 RepID=UPI003AB352ED